VAQVDFVQHHPRLGGVLALLHAVEVALLHAGQHVARVLPRDIPGREHEPARGFQLRDRRWRLRPRRWRGRFGPLRRRLHPRRVPRGCLCLHLVCALAPQEKGGPLSARACVQGEAERDPRLVVQLRRAHSHTRQLRGHLGSRLRVRGCRCPLSGAVLPVEDGAVRLAAEADPAPRG